MCAKENHHGPHVLVVQRFDDAKRWVCVCERENVCVRVCVCVCHVLVVQRFDDGKRYVCVRER